MMMASAVTTISSAPTPTTTSTATTITDGINIDMLMSGGVSRSGRVRKKSSKLLDFQSPDDVEKKHSKRASTIKGQNRRGRRPRSTAQEYDYFSQNDEDNNDDNAHDKPHDVSIDDSLPDLSDLGSLNASPLDVKLLDEANHVTGGDNVHAMVSNQALLDNLLSGAPDSEDELDNLVADLVEGVQAECLEQSNKNLADNKTPRQSLYMTEKSSNKRKMLTGKIERKDKGKSRFTAYSLWSRDFRQSSKFSSYQDLDFSSTARRLGELWANVSVKEKAIWRRKAKQHALKSREMENNSKTDQQQSSPETSPNKINAMACVNNNNNNSNSNNNNISNNNVFSTPFLNRATTSRTKKLAEAAAAAAAAANNKLQNNKINLKNNNNSNKESKNIDTGSNTKRRRNNLSQKQTVCEETAQDVDHQVYAVVKSNTNNNNNNNNNNTNNNDVITQNKMVTSSGSVGISAIDAAAHLKLLGESLSIIGKRLKEHDGQIAVSGSLSVLLDSLLCSMGPLLCLTTHLPGLENEMHLQTNLTNILDNIAYVMPGL